MHVEKYTSSPPRSDHLRRTDAANVSAQPSALCNNVTRLMSASGNGTQYALSGCSGDVNTILDAIRPPMPTGCGAVLRNVSIGWQGTSVHEFPGGIGFYRTLDGARDSHFEDCVVKAGEQRINLGGPSLAQSGMNQVVLINIISAMMIVCVLVGIPWTLWWDLPPRQELANDSNVSDMEPAVMQRDDMEAACDSPSGV